MVRELAKGDFTKMLPSLFGSLKQSSKGDSTASVDAAINGLLSKLLGGK